MPARPMCRMSRRLRKRCKLKLREEEGASPIRTEGEREGRWVVIDYGDVLVHIFHKEERRGLYQLERLWKVEGNFYDYSAEHKEQSNPPDTSLKTGGSGNGPAGNAVSGAVLPAGKKRPLGGWAVREANERSM